MGIIVIGTITRDTLILPDKNICRITTSLGGTLYNIITLALLTDKTIIPISNIGYDIYDEVMRLLSKYPNIHLDGLRKIKQKNNHCQLCFFSEYPAEVLENRVPPVKFSQCRHFLKNCDFISITFTSGFDIGLRTLRLIKSRVECLIHMDYHMLVFGIDELGNRFLKKRVNWRDWIKIADIIQFNRFEAEYLFGEKIIDDKDVLIFGRNILKHSGKAVIVTLGAEGSVVVYRDKNKIKHEHIKAMPPERGIDTTGCGVVYSAGFISNYLKYNNIIDACKFASIMASKKVSFSGVVHLNKVIHL